MNVARQVALVTGGGGMLGTATAQLLLERGARVALLDLEPSPLASTAEDAHFVRADVTDEQQVERAVAAAAELGPLRVVVHCAGAGVIHRTIDRQGRLHDVAAFRRMLEINAVGTFMVIVHAAAQMRLLEPVGGDGERGVIVTTSSLAGLEGSAGQVAYGAAKAAVAGMTLPVARDLAPMGIRAVAVAPGGMSDLPDDEAAGDPRLAALIGNVPHPSRLGRPEEFAALVGHIVENPYLNGCVLRLDGGARLGLKY